MAAVTERSLAPEINVVDIHDDVVWSRTGHLTLVYRVEAFHEPGLDGADFDAAALLAENSWAGLPEFQRPRPCTARSRELPLSSRRGPAASPYPA